MTIKEMQDNVVGKYGLEAKETITFFKLCGHILIYLDKLECPQNEGKYNHQK